ncbi:MAG: deoxyribose-phosphate aldolase [Deltaproteobacteria bacterium RIFCSPLOWO2_12_FULL_44_12]|nr:MAG: deoxyribose-phosphate aldolase [Deltaproteobacteria bacterium RIFCSPHIGHO2_01_FULL_43_49]OGQ15930.1 MAG: deoxyribose-phosphate aldolase [Deltaproteobacteria bacterium RIFCSPHIGHO2_02_FULL_44_53]OGQ28892.1 MAG: deoxyribose-phosphate aldolase [Deltaproteobacteria bacterium RIFCSPHIGHO2_12_FULL_44_21]OGQ30984.1 MAG: deoxyribose-phosphate aldolase [Deltaproteobacteria bacterium RIFCSPLOWO2_01_FULL_45_74]OGQ43490.1 MAG: deoxyribose-phosphate aldolase [Deltaproteobacteria bacterium RIFCSPLOWO
MQISTSSTVDQVGIEERAAALSKRSIKKQTKIEGIKLAISMIDLTTLEGKDSPGKVQALCQKAIHPLEGNSSVPSVAAVCVYPNMVSVAKKALKGTNVKVASVATGFPSGLTPLPIKIEETKRVVEMGADEVDMVIDRGAFLAGEYQKVSDEIAQVKEACGKSHLKVILETGELETYDNVRKASFLAMQAGADFIKTSTGKAAVNATLPVTLVMLEAIRDYWYQTGKMVGMKPAGGIRTSKQALQYLVVVKETLGDRWLSNDWFRFGASTLTNDLLMQLTKEATGRYQSLDYFTID